MVDAWCRAMAGKMVMPFEPKLRENSVLTQLSMSSVAQSYLNESNDTCHWHGFRARPPVRPLVRSLLPYIVVSATVCTVVDRSIRVGIIVCAWCIVISTVIN